MRRFFPLNSGKENKLPSKNKKENRHKGLFVKMSLLIVIILPIYLLSARSSQVLASGYCGSQKCTGGKTCCTKKSCNIWGDCVGYSSCQSAGSCSSSCSSDADCGGGIKTKPKKRTCSVKRCSGSTCAFTTIKVNANQTCPNDSCTTSYECKSGGGSGGGGSGSNTGCTSDYQCSFNEYCSPWGCMRKLSSGANCTRNSMCATGTCYQGRCIDPLPNGGRCNYYTDCASGYCDGSDPYVGCQRAGGCTCRDYTGRCSQWDDCPSGQHCDTSRGVCVNGPPTSPCRTDADCGQGYSCQGGLCKGERNGGWCPYSQQECASGCCVGATCRPAEYCGAPTPPLTPTPSGGLSRCPFVCRSKFGPNACPPSRRVPSLSCSSSTQVCCKPDSSCPQPGAPTNLNFHTSGCASEGYSPPVTFSWSRVLGADRYQIQVSTNENFTGVMVVDDEVDNPSNGNPSYTTSRLSASTNYYWRVRAHNSCGRWSEWSVYTSP